MKSTAILSLGMVLLISSMCFAADIDGPSNRKMLAERPEERELLGATVRDNIVEVHTSISQNIGSMSFELDPAAVSVTAGQPFEGVTGSYSAATGVLTLNARAGRKNNEANAAFFGQQVGGGASMLGLDVDSTDPAVTPAKLNFAFCGSLTIDGASRRVCFGQGNDGLGHNNWWVGVNGGAKAGFKELTFEADTATYAFTTYDTGIVPSFESRVNKFGLMRK